MQSNAIFIQPNKFKNSPPHTSESSTQQHPLGFSASESGTMKEWDFKAPTEPPKDYDPENPYADKVAFWRMREYVIHRKAVKLEKAKILKERLEECYMREGVNHFQNCRELANLYLKYMKGTSIGLADSDDIKRIGRGKFVLEDDE